MTEAMQNKLGLFAENVRTIRGKFFFEDHMTKRLAALLYAQEGKAIDCDAIRRCHEMIKKNTGIFSRFRGNMALCIASLLSLKEEQQSLLDKTLGVYKLLKAAKFFPSDFLVVAAFQIATQADSAEYVNVVARTRAFYEGMKAKHFFYTGQDDYIFSAMLGITGLEPEAATARIETLFSQMKGGFFYKNSVQSLAQVLVLGSADDAAENRVFKLRDAFRAEKIRLDRSYTLPVLGILALLSEDMDTVVKDVDEAKANLRNEKGFGWFSVPTQELLLYAASLVAGEYAEGIKNGVITAAVSTSITNIIIAQQAALIAAMSASHAAASASSSSASS
jgi:hypothetical protein